MEVRSKVVASIFSGENILKYIDQHTGVSYFEDDLFFPKDLNQDPDYWERLKHQYAGMAMQGMCANHGWDNCTWGVIANDAYEAAHALVEKYKKEK